MRIQGFILICLVLLFGGCIKDPPFNPEADIETFTVNAADVTSPPFIDQANRRIFLYLKDQAYRKGIAPTLTVSSGAAILPASGDSIHFDAPVIYTVTSQSGENKKSYEVKVVNVGNWTFNFERWTLNEADQYEHPMEDDGVVLWSSGNPGVALAGVPKTPTAYPTRHTDGGYLQTKGAELVTIKGTFLSEFVGIKLIAGSMFLGNFNSSFALADPLAATEFGQPYVGLPDKFTGYYTYKPGPDFQDKEGNIIAGHQDQCSIYAVLYNGPEKLNGKNVHTSDKIIAKAELTDGIPKSAFTRFDIPFVYIPNAVVSDNLLMAIVVSSSSEGDVYRGAIGSKLVVDSLRIIPR